MGRGVQMRRRQNGRAGVRVQWRVLWLVLGVLPLPMPMRCSRCCRRRLACLSPPASLSHTPCPFLHSLSIPQCYPAHPINISCCCCPPLPRQVDGIGNLVELNGRFAAELDSPVLMVGAWRRCVPLLLHG